MKRTRTSINIAPLLLATAILGSSVGCASLPWRAKKPQESAEYQTYMDQADTNPTYDQSYQSTAVNGGALPPPVVSPSDRVANASSDCKDGCCH